MRLFSPFFHPGSSEVGGAKTPPSLIATPKEMVVEGKFGLEVLVGGVPLREHVSSISGRTYVETEFNTPVSFMGLPQVVFHFIVSTRVVITN